MNPRSSRDEALGVRKLSASFAFTAGASNVAEVAISVVDKDAVVVPGIRTFTLWLSDNATGKGLTGTTASGTVTVKTSSGAVIGTLTTKMALVVQTLESGIFTLEITDSAKTTFYVAVSFDNYDPPVVSRIMATADYGA